MQATWLLWTRTTFFVIPLATDFGWHLKEAVPNLTYEFCTGDLTTLYERNGIYCFDAWVQPGPQKKGEREKNSANAVNYSGEGE